MTNVNRVELFFAKVSARLRPVLRAVSALVLLFVAAELISFATLRLYAILTPPPPAEEPPHHPWQLMDVFAGVEWAETYFEEFDRSHRTRYHPYTEYRRWPFSGRYINVDSSGVRRTVPDCGSGRDDALRIFVMGGSAAWGSGARDEATIPSHLTRMLCDRGIPTTTTNFGESGYTNTQELIQLQLELRRGRIPDIVIFYDGVNDVYSSYQNRRPGLPQNVVHRMQGSGTPRATPSRITRIALLTNTGELVHALATRLLGAAGRSGPRWAPARDADAARLDRMTLEIMMENIRIVRALGSAFGFQSFFYWQPAVYSKATQSDDERNVIAKDTVFGNMYLRTTELIAQQQTIADLSGVFDDDSTSVFIDEFHISERGNEKVADMILDDLLEYLELGPPPAYEN